MWLRHLNFIIKNNCRSHYRLRRRLQYGLRQGSRCQSRQTSSVSCKDERNPESAQKLPLLIAVPTTAGTGSETTLAAVIVDAETRHKYAINDFPLIPRYAVLDPKVTLSLPPFITATTGMDALTHAVEAYIGNSHHTRHP